ncbi:MAG: cation:proton antiporter [Anaerolineae bacterium]
MILSVALVVTLGIVVSRVFIRRRFPGLLGMMAVGIALGPYGFDVLHRSILENASGIRLIVLIVILLHTGLGLEKDLLSRHRRVVPRRDCLDRRRSRQGDHASTPRAGHAEYDPGECLTGRGWFMSSRVRLTMTHE